MGKSVRPVVQVSDEKDLIPVDTRAFQKGGLEYNKYDVGLNATEYQDKMKFRQTRQGIGEAIGNTFGQILTTVAGQTIQGIDALTLGGLEALSTLGTDNPTDFSSPIGEFGRAIEDWGRSEMPILADQSAGWKNLN